MKSLLVGAATAAMLLLGACNASAPGAVQDAASGAAAPQVSPVGLDVIPVTVHAAGRTHRFNVEVARTPDQQAQGLMYRTSLGPNEGMLFPFQPPRPASFWMKNTLIPLDMLFIRADGSIARIAANTVPQSLEAVMVGEPVAAVLELRGGRAAELGITESDRVTWSDRPRR